MRPRLEQERGRDWNHRERQQERGGQRKDDRQRHRDEELALQPLQRQQRHEHDDDDQHARRDGLQHLAHRSKNDMDQRHRRGRSLLAEVRDDVLDDDHERVDQHSDRDGEAAEAHQVGGHPGLAHDDQGDDDRQRKAQRDDQRGPPIAEEQQQQDDHQDGGFGQRADDRADGAPDQSAAVIEDVDRNAFRQRRLKLLQALAHVAHELARIGTAQTEHESLDRLAAAVDRDGAVACELADANAGDVADPDRRPIARLDDDRADVVDGADAALDADKRAVLALVDAAGPVVAAVRRDRAPEGLGRDAAGGEGGADRHDLEGADIAAERIDVGHAGDRAQRRPDHPVEQGPALCERQVGAVDREHEHLAERAGDRGEAAAHAFRQVARDVGQALRDLVARPVDVGAVLEIEGDVGERVFGRRAQDLLVRDPEQLELDRHGNPLLDLLGGEARRLHDDFHLDRRDVGKCIDRQGGKAGRRRRR